MTGARKVVQNALYLAGTNGLNLAAALTFAFLTSRYLGKAGFGRMILILSLMTFYEGTFRASVSMVLTQRTAQRPENAAAYWWPSIAMHLGFGAFFLVGGILGARLLGGGPLLIEAALFAAGISAARLLSESAVGILRGLDRMGPEFWTTLGERILYLALLVAFMARYRSPAERAGIGFLAVFALNAVTQCVQTALLLWPLWRKLRPAWTLDRERLGELYRASSPIWICGLMMALHWRVEIFCLGRFSTAGALASFGAAFKVLEAAKILPWFLCMAVFPALSRQAADSSDRFRATYVFVLKLLLLLSAPVAAALYLLAPVILRLYPADFSDAIGPLLWMSAAILPLFLNGLFAYGVVAREKQPLMVWTYTGATALQATIAYPLIHRFGATGGALSFLIGELGLLIFGLLATERGISPLPRWALLRPLLCVVGVGGMLMALTRYSAPLAAAAALGALGMGVSALGVFTREEIRRLRALVKL